MVYCTQLNVEENHLLRVQHQVCFPPCSMHFCAIFQGNGLTHPLCQSGSPCRSTLVGKWRVPMFASIVKQTTSKSVLVFFPSFKNSKWHHQRTCMYSVWCHVLGASLATFLNSFTLETGHCMTVQLTGTIGTPDALKATTTPSLFSAVVR